MELKAIILEGILGTEFSPFDFQLFGEDIQVLYALWCIDILRDVGCRYILVSFRAW